MTDTLTQDSPSSLSRAAIAVAAGDGIGPEIMAAVLEILDHSGARLDPTHITIGESVYKSGVTSGIGPEAWEAIRGTKVLLKAPISTPQGGGMKSLNVTLRKSLGLYANVRPCPTYSPFVPTQHPGMDLVIIRENEEDLYAGIEHRQTDEVVQCLKLMSRTGCERIARYAFEYARSNGRKKITCMTKDNIMKLTDGLFHRMFDEVGAEYPDIKQEHMIIDIGAAKLASQPKRFDMILAPNLYGDILSDIAAEVTGSVGLAGSANIGDGGAMFEAVHGSAPDIAGQDIANPSGLLLSAVMMHVHLGQSEVASRVHNAWLRTIEDGIHPVDLYQSGNSRQQVGTAAFAKAVVERLGQVPQTLEAVKYPENKARLEITVRPSVPAVKVRKGIDVFIQHRGAVDTLAPRLQALEADGLHLQMITNRGVVIWPKGLSETMLTDHWRCRFLGPDVVTSHDIARLITRIADSDLDLIKTEILFNFDGVPGYSLGQGQ